MVDRVNRRDQILETASRLFLEQGYSATSVRNIADEVGVTEAALYYHFKDGKEALFREVVANKLPNLLEIVERCESADSLHDFIVRYGTAMRALGPEYVTRFSWLLGEIPHLNTDEIALLQAKHLKAHEELARIIGRFVHQPRQAGAIAWTLMCAAFGYGQIFFNLQMTERTDFVADEMVDVIARSFSNYASESDAGETSETKE